MRLGVGPSSLRAWLRRQSAAGNPLLRPHRHGADWTFSPDVAAALADAYAGKDADAALGTQEPPPLETRTESAGLAVVAAANTAPTDDSVGHATGVEWLGSTVMTLADLLRPGLAKYDYPPDQEDKAVELILEQAELFATHG